MFTNPFSPSQQDEPLEINLDPRPGIYTPSPADIQLWLDEDVEVIDLGEIKRDEVIQPTTWHASE